MRTSLFLIFVFFIAQSYSVQLHTVGRCLSDLLTQEYTNSYNYLQLSSNFGTTNAYPGFSSWFIKLSDDDSSKAHEIVKFLTLRKIQLNRLISQNGIHIDEKLTDISNITQSLTEIRHHNNETIKIIQRCHQDASNINDANIQDYLESQILDYHIKIDKTISDIQHRIQDSPIFDQQLTIFLIDEEFLNTYGDRRKDIFD